MTDFDNGEYEHVRRVCYGTHDSPEGTAQFIPVCCKCGRFVKADGCGRVEMLFEGFM